MDETETPRMRVNNARGAGVTVKVWKGEPDFVHTATGWAEVDHWAAEYHVPAEMITIDADAAETLGPR
jgi:hypothetical protein